MFHTKRSLGSYLFDSKGDPEKLVVKDGGSNNAKAFT
jgi:hypothetical protein